MENTSNYSNSKNNNFTSKTTSNNEMKSIDESVSKENYTYKNYFYFLYVYIVF